MATLQERIDLAEKNLHSAAQETQLAYHAYRDLDAAQTRIGDELRDLRRQRRSRDEQIGTARRELEEAAGKVRVTQDDYRTAESEDRDAEAAWQVHMNACQAQEDAQCRLEELEAM